MKIVDQIYHCQMPGQVFGTWQLQCHLRIFQPHAEVQTVLVTNMGFEMGWFIPYLVEKLIDQVVQEFRLDPGKLVWIEHYTSGMRNLTEVCFSQVTFDWQAGQAANPRWQVITPEWVQTLTNEHWHLLNA